MIICDGSSQYMAAQIDLSDLNSLPINTHTHTHTLTHAPDMYIYIYIYVYIDAVIKEHVLLFNATDYIYFAMRWLTNATRI